MRVEISEADWRAFGPVLKAAQERYCQRVFEKANAIQNKTDWDVVERFERVCRLFRDRSREYMKLCDYRRSTAVVQLIVLDNMDLITEEERARFSEEVQSQLRMYREMREG
jgi:c-di-AMP phosphodiesterase-like protein